MPARTGTRGVPSDTLRVSRHWGASGGEYLRWADRRVHAAIGDGDRLYAQVSSPIRRLVDLVNVVRLIQALDLRHASPESVDYADHWTSRLGDVQSAAVAARRLQSECELLDRCTKARDSGDVAHGGYPIALEDSTTNERAYVVHVPSLKHLVRVRTQDTWPLLAKRAFRLHVFLDEATMHRKVRVVAHPNVVSES